MFYKNLFHKHNFDGTKWKKVGIIDLVLPTFEIDIKVGSEIIYTNTCLTCGNLVSQKIKIK